MSRGGSKPRHGDSIKGKRFPLYGVWATMHSRCYNPKATSYKNYGARGIKVCAAWDDYSTFKNWALESGYGPGLEIDRIDVNGDYEPHNCRWVLRLANRNKRDNRMVGGLGEFKCLAAWAQDARCVVSYHALKKRLNRGVPIEEALTEPALRAGKYSRKRPLRYYLAGGMRGFPDGNKLAFAKAAAQLRAHGFSVFNPAEKGLEAYPGASNNDKEFMRAVFHVDTQWICRYADAIALLPGWEKSKGARAEKALAEAIGLDVKFINLETGVLSDHAP